jgi:hypothetical protein
LTVKSVSFASDDTYSVGVDRAAQLDPLGERLRRVDEHVVARSILPLIERSGLDRVAGAADVAAVGRHRVHRVVDERVGRIGGRRRRRQDAVAVQRVGRPPLDR